MSGDRKPVNKTNPLTADPSMIERASYDTVHGYPGGAPALAARIGMRSGTLNNKVDPGYAESELFLREALAVMLATGDFSVADALEGCLGRVAVSVGDFSGTSDLELLNLYAQYHESQGQTAQAMRESLEDGKITRDEARRIRAEGMKDAQAFFELLSRIEALVHD